MPGVKRGVMTDLVDIAGNIQDLAGGAERTGTLVREGVDADA
jgi:hypothetical protein